MNTNDGFRPQARFLPLVIAAFSFAPTFADSLTARSSKQEYCVFEPIVVHVTLELSEPFVKVHDDPVEAARQQRRLSKKLTAELRLGDATLCKAFLSGGQFAANADRGYQFHATVYGCLGTKLPGKVRSRFLFWERPGRYTLVIRDIDNRLDSNEIRVEIVQPDDRSAADLFSSGGLDTLSLVLVQEYGRGMVSAFKILADEYSDSIYGKYARMALVLRRAENARARKVKMTPGMWGALAQNLKEAIVLFDPGHPLRGRALWYLAKAQRAPNVKGDPKETLQQLLSETSDGYLIRTAEEFLANLDRTPLPRYDRARKESDR